MKRFAVCILTLLLLGTSVYAQAPYFILQLEADEAVFLDESLQVEISVADYVYGAVYGTSALDFSFAYDERYLEFKGLETSAGAFATVGQTVYEDVYGGQRVLVSMLGSEHVITSDRDVLTLTFEPREVVGGTAITLYDVKAATSEGIIFYPGATRKYIDVVHAYDVNKDGKIDLADLAIVSYRVGSDAAEYRHADVNRDGRIDLEDVQLLMEYLFTL